MLIGLLSESHGTDRRVGLTPDGARTLVLHGHEVVIEAGAGEAARFPDDDYRAAGARIIHDTAEVFSRSRLLLKVSPVQPSEVPALRQGQAVLAFHHLAASSREHLEAMLARGVTLIGCEIVEDGRGNLPILHAMSEIAGQLAVHAGAHLLETRRGGRGILLGGATGIPPAHVVVIGAGEAGLWAARTAAGNRAQVTVLDTSPAALRRVEELLGRAVITEVAHRASIARAVSYADVLIGAVLVRGERAPRVVTRDMVQRMRPGAVIVDLSIDQGGCVETSRPRTIEDPVFVEAGITHYAVPNMTAVVARTASMALSHASVPFLLAVADSGIESALRENPGLAAGTYAYGGTLVSRSLAASFGLKCESLSDLVGTTDYPSVLV